MEWTNCWSIRITNVCALSGTDILIKIFPQTCRGIVKKRIIKRLHPINDLVFPCAKKIKHKSSLNRLTKFRSKTTNKIQPDILQMNSQCPIIENGGN